MSGSPHYKIFFGSSLNNIEELKLLTTLADCSSIRDVETIACMRGRIGGYSEEDTPVPIPNTVVKLFSSDDTVGAAPWENRASPLHPLTSAPPPCGAHLPGPTTTPSLLTAPPAVPCSRLTWGGGV